MAESDDELARLAEAGAAAHEKFVNDGKALDKAWLNGTLDTELDRLLAEARSDL